VPLAFETLSTLNGLPIDDMPFAMNAAEPDVIAAQPPAPLFLAPQHDARPLAARMGEGEGADDGDDGAARPPGGPATSVITRTKVQAKRPSLYRVLILNDDYTPMEFVVHVLERFFNKDIETATQIMLHVHHQGIGECGVYTYEVAETKVTQVMDFARKHQHPLQCVMEKK